MKWLNSDRVQKGLLSGIVFFNLLDIIFTLTVINAGFAVEANPFMHGVMEKSELTFAFIKLSLVSLCIFLLWRLREHSVARISALFCFLVYGFLMLYHVGGVIISLHISYLS